MLATAYGASFVARTPFTITSFKFCTFKVSIFVCASAAWLAKEQNATLSAIPLNLFIYLN